jgi:hypothetical protein
MHHLAAHCQSQLALMVQTLQ